ncbi:hypothetical protein BCV70DRAFT_7630 [Testicularia cyperi]|uniref:Uncharacterized protein n=1 Tax=Testicularia cyperi TaxID=1882483 RepID=A0A317XXN1_9BASI|nr:hypothetical protein BCV70DRAFT_7630 [Testicularia cyperi]
MAKTYDLLRSAHCSVPAIATATAIATTVQYSTGQQPAASSSTTVLYCAVLCCTEGGISKCTTVLYCTVLYCLLDPSLPHRGGIPNCCLRTSVAPKKDACNSPHLSLSAPSLSVCLSFSRRRTARHDRITSTSCMYGCLS